jgi:DNA integrity scanning protein DisA with diadenylate cyclase activity
MDEYPSANDYREIVEEFVGRDKMQTFLRDNKGFVVHADTKKKVADVSRLVFYGHEFTNELRKGALEYDADAKSTAFSLYSEASDEELLSDLQNARDDEKTFDDKKNLRVQNASEIEEGLELTLEYTNKKIGRRELIAEDDRDTSVVIVETGEENVRTVQQNYERIDEFNAVSSFFENWNKRRKENEDEEVKRYNIALRRLALQKRISLFDDLLSYNPGNWILGDVLQIGIKQGEQITEMFDDVDNEEDLKEELDDNLEGITDAVLTGEGLQANGFVQKCRSNGYYFKSARLYYDNVDVAEKVEILIEFKEGNRRSFDVSVEQGYEKKEGKVDRTSFDSSREKEIRDQFRQMVIDAFSDYLKPSEMRERDVENTELTDISGVSNGLVETLNENGYDSIDDVREATVEELQEIDGIGETTAERLVDA